MEQMLKVKPPQSYSAKGKNLDRQQIFKQDKEKLERIRKKYSSVHDSSNLQQNKIVNDETGLLNSTVQSSPVNNLGQRNTHYFKSIERHKNPGYFHFFQLEDSTEAKYTPKYQVTQPTFPKYTIQKAAFERKIHELQVKQEDKSKCQTEYHICTKNQLVENIQPNNTTKAAKKFRSNSQYSGSQTYVPGKKNSLTLTALNELELINESVNKDRVYEQDKKWIQLDKQLPRQPNLCQVNGSYEGHFGNYNQIQTDLYKVHDFTSYTKRPEVFPGKPSPQYNLLNVNYDRIMERQNKGYKQFGNYPDFKNTKFDNMDVPPVSKLEYPLATSNFKKQIVVHKAEYDMSQAVARSKEKVFWPTGRPDHGVKPYNTKQVEYNQDLKGFRNFDKKYLQHVNTNVRNQNDYNFKFHDTAKAKGL